LAHKMIVRGLVRVRLHGKERWAVGSQRDNSKAF
jgi:hypothetical protein